MGLEDLSVRELENRLELIIRERKAIPNKEVMESVGYWDDIYQAIESTT